MGDHREWVSLVHRGSGDLLGNMGEEECLEALVPWVLLVTVSFVRPLKCRQTEGPAKRVLRPQLSLVNGGPMWHPPPTDCTASGVTEQFSVKITCDTKILSDDCFHHLHHHHHHHHHCSFKDRFMNCISVKLLYDIIN